VKGYSSSRRGTCPWKRCGMDFEALKLDQAREKAVT
jgi:hypothetical protein